MLIKYIKANISKTSNHNTFKKQQIAREKGKNRDHKEYILTF